MKPEQSERCHTLRSLALPERYTPVKSALVTAGVLFPSIRDVQFNRDVQAQMQALTAHVVADVVEGIRRQPHFPRRLCRPIEWRKVVAWYALSVTEYSRAASVYWRGRRE